VDKWVEVRANQGYAGTINFGSASQVGTISNLRMTTAGGLGDWSNTVFNFTGPTIITNRQGGNVDFVQTIAIGEIHAADPLSGMQSFLGGSTAIPTNFRIGALGTDSDFAGTLADGGGSNMSTSQLHLTKVGAGTLTLTGSNTYTGDTAVFGGVLSSISPTLDDASTVRVNMGGTYNLNYGGTDTIGALILDGVSVALGVWGGPSSGAANISNLFSGSGTLTVTDIRVPGDFDGNDMVDAADLAVWQAAYNTTSLGDADGDFDSDGADFLVWQRNLGMTAAVASTGAVPEPASAALAAGCLAAVAALRRRSSARA
jgi:autotransporter-associated beta strand protein